MTTLKIFTDGGSLNNPGPAACAYVMYVDDVVVHSFHKALGVATNNVAEYNGLIHALTDAPKIIKTLPDPVSQISVFADSELMVRQVTGVYKVKNADIRVLHTKVMSLVHGLTIPITFTHVLRDKNTLADSLVKKALGR